MSHWELPPRCIRPHPPGLAERLLRRAQRQPLPDDDIPHILLPQWLQARMPAYKDATAQGDPIAYVRYIVPDSPWEWYGFGWKEHQGEHYFYGWVNGDYPEFGSFTLGDVQGLAASLDVQAERDVTFVPRPISVIRKELGK